MEVKCTFANEESRDRPYICKVTACNIESRSSVIEIFKGHHRRTKDNKSVKGLWFYNTKVHFIPRNLAKILPNLTRLSIERCELIEVSAENLIGFEQLEFLGLEGNKIATLPVNLFKNLPKLRDARFNENLITTFDVKILEPVKNTIEFFDISNNPGVSEKFDKEKENIEHFIERLRLAETNKKIKDNLEARLKLVEDLFVTGKYADFTFKAHETEYRVHKCILASQSAVFDEIFSIGAESAAEIRNFSQETFKEFLRYFYTKTVPSEELASDLFQLAVEYDVPDLKRQCEEIMMQNFNALNALQRYNLAVQLVLPKLKRAAFDAVKDTYKEIDEYLYNKPDVVNALIQAKLEFAAMQVVKMEEEELKQEK